VARPRGARPPSAGRHALRHRARLAKEGAQKTLKVALQKGFNLRDFGDGSLGITLDETVEPQDLLELLAAFGASPLQLRLGDPAPSFGSLARTSSYLEHPTFHRYRSEHELLRYIHRLQHKDLSLTTSMIPLGSCTMKLNATAEMYPVSLPGFGGMHPFARSTRRRVTRRSSTRCRAGCARSRAFRAVRCSRTRARRVSTRACS
jgi:hypothetical protein